MNKCNVLVLGNSDINENFFITKHIDIDINVTSTTNNFDGNSHFNKNDWHIQENNKSVQVNFKKVKVKELETALLNEPDSTNFLFIIALDAQKTHNLSEYTFNLITKIKHAQPSSLIIYILINESSKFKFPKLELLNNFHPLVREVFRISNTKNFDQEFDGLRYVLKQIITNEFTDRLNEVKERINENFITKNPNLDLGKSGLTSFYEIPELFKNTHLEELIISNEWAVFKNGKWHRRDSDNTLNPNSFRNFIPEIEKLKKLRVLIAGGDWKRENGSWSRWGISDIQLLSKLKNLEYLNVSNNMIKHLPSLNPLKKLKVLHLNNNEIYSTYRSLEIPTLQELYLSNNKIYKIAFLKNLHWIKTLDLHANNITDLKDIITLIENIGVKNSKWEQGTINVYKNKLSTPPVEIIINGSDAVLQYFKDLQSGKSFINKDIKLILVGNSEVGKTTLAKYLNDEKDLDKEHFATHWLEEVQVQSKHIINKINGKCTINIFDFGGHDFYHDTHHLFFTSNTLYIILWDAASNSLNPRSVHSTKNDEKILTQDYPLEYWLDSIKYFAKEKKTESLDSSIKQKDEYNSWGIVTQNKVDKKEDIIFLNQEKLIKSHPFIYDFINMSITPVKRNLEYFDLLLAEALNSVEIIGAELPEYFGIIKDKIKGNDKLETIVSINQFNDFCNSVTASQLTLEQTKNLALYLKNIGVILYYPKDNEDSPIYLNKNEIVNSIHSILDGLQEKNGEFDFSYIDLIIQKSDDYKKSIINLMIDFKMIFKNPESNLYIAPLYLPSSATDSIELFIDNDKTPYRRFFYKGFIHKSVILEFYQEYGKYVLADKGEDNKPKFYYWKDGLVIKDELTREIVMIRFYLGDDNGNAHIDVIRLNKDGKSVFVDDIIKYINKINKDIDGFEERVTIDGKDYIEIKLLDENAKEGRLIFTEKSIEEKNTNQPNVQNKIFKLKDYMDFINDGIKRKKVVISYSKDDLKRVDVFIKYLKPLVDLELIDHPWYCTDLIPAEEWELEIKKNLEKADIVFFMVSPNFYNTPFIVDEEIPMTIDRYEKDKKSVKIIPIILEFYDWVGKQPYSLKRFTALPYQAKPMSDYKNENLAWYMVSKSVRHMIEYDLDSENIEINNRELQKFYERQVEGKLDI